MTRPIVRRGVLVLAASASLIVAAFAAVPAAQASTLYACVTKGGTPRVYPKKPKKCKKGEKLLSWNSSGVAGKSGANGINGTNGTNGTPGQPQSAVKFKSSLAVGESAPLFTADGIKYTFDCTFAIFFDAGSLDASGSAGESYASGTFTRPKDDETKETDPKSSAFYETIGGTEEKLLAFTTDVAENSAKEFTDDGVWTVTVEGPTTVTWIHAFMETGPACSTHGTAITVPD